MEIWKKVVINGVCFPDYEVSNSGRIRSLKPSNRIKDKNGFLSFSSRNGYSQVVITAQKDKKGKSRITARVHRIVAEAFIGQSSLAVNHIDGDKKNNNINNLEYVTSFENIDHARKMGLRKHVSYRCMMTKERNKTRGNKLTFPQAQKIRELAKSGITRREIGEMFGITHQTVSGIVAYKFWKAVPISNE